MHSAVGSPQCGGCACFVSARVQVCRPLQIAEWSVVERGHRQLGPVAIWTSTKRLAATPLASLSLRVRNCGVSSVGSGPPWQSAPGRIATATRQCQRTGVVGPQLRAKHGLCRGKSLSSRKAARIPNITHGRWLNRQRQWPWSARRSSATCGTGRFWVVPCCWGVAEAVQVEEGCP